MHAASRQAGHGPPVVDRNAASPATSYTYEFQVDGMMLTGTASSANGEVEITDGKVDGDRISFVENLTFQGMELEITYTGTMVSDDEIEFTRNVAGIADEELTATRVE